MTTELNKKRIISLWEHSGWGNSVFFTNWEQRKITGFLREKPSVGDIVRSQMKSGRIAQFEIIEIEYSETVFDMFFAVLKDLEYEN